MSIEREFVPYQESLELKELGFDEQCFSFYDREGKLYESEGYYKRGDNVYEHEVIAPTFSQAFRFFRENHNQWNYIYPNIHERDWNYHIQYYECGEMWGGIHIVGDFKTYEEAELACLKKLIQIVKEEQ